MPDIITIANDGPDIVFTDYWATEQAAHGAVYFSINAGTFRLLVPPAFAGEIEEWRLAHEVIVSRGPWPDQGRADALEILFWDDTSSPYAIHIGAGQTDRLPPDTDRDRRDQPPRWKFSAWTQEGKALELPCRYRVVKRIPWLKKF